MILRVLRNRKAQPKANATRMTMMNNEPTGWVTMLSSIVRFTKAMNSVRRARAHTVMVTRKAMRPSLRSPATICALPGTKRVRRTSTKARLVRTGALAPVG
ncbi:hypothetical protein D3C73_1323070 [compost metagenome]